ncbi:MAG TPA: hypothetical protein VN031_02025 [Candidatus Microsaccharimonas sp.]|nr:hypothetical protein [Candidatus Microsaccharimonas sp.]
MTALIGEQPSVTNVTELHNPHVSEGFFDLEHVEDTLHYHEPEVVDWSEPVIELNPYPGVRSMLTTVFTLDTGAQHIKRDIMPSHQNYDTKVGMMTALATRVNGFNTLNALRIAAGGSEVSLVGFNQAAAFPSSLSADAEAATLLLGYTFNRREQLMNDDRAVVLEGKSRGAMGAFGISAYAAEYGLEVPVSFHQDPCLARQTGVRETLQKLTPLDLADEVLEFGHCIKERWDDESPIAYLKRLCTMAHTVGVTPNYLLAQIHSGKALWAGEAGSFVKHIPNEQVIIANFFNKNRLNHHDEFEAQIRQRPHGRIIGEKLRHMALMRREVVENGAQSVWTAQALLDIGAEPSTIADVLARPLVTDKLAGHRASLSLVA